MDAGERLRLDFGAAMAVGGGVSAADRLCVACVELLDVDGASISVLYGGSSRGTIGSSSELSRRLDEFQFTFGEGPCVDAVTSGQPVLVADLRAVKEHRWPVFAGAVLDAGVRAVFALPVLVASSAVGALDLFRAAPGSLAGGDLAGGLYACELAALPLLDLIRANPVVVGGGSGPAPVSLERVEVYQATGMIMARLDVDATEALVRLRAHAFAHGLTASEVAWHIVERRLMLDDDPPVGRGRPAT